MIELKIKKEHPCKECIVRSICRFNCQKFNDFRIDVYTKINEYIELNLGNRSVIKIHVVKRWLYNKYVEKWRCDFEEERTRSRA